MSGSATDLFSGGIRSTKSIVNYFSSGGVVSPGAVDISASAINNAKEVLSGALTANTLKSVLSITVPGSMPYLAAYSKDGTARTIRLVVCVDGVISPYAFDSTTSSFSSANRGVIAAGVQAGNYVPGGPAINWAASCEVFIASSLTETDKVAIAYNAETKV